jgi:hypothetical protein
MEKSEHLQFAEHNEKTCNYLNDKGDFIDWVITTAFYSSIHYIHHKILPYTYKFPDGTIRDYQNFEKLYQQFKGGAQSKHGFLRNFVEANHEEIAIDFQHLMDTCMTARYIDYRFEPVAAKVARMRLKKIKKYCTGLD